MLAALLVSTALAAPVANVAIVPGCPTESDGALSRCLDRRSAWAAHLYATGKVENFITSGSAVYNRYVEAETLARAMIARGVPPERVVVEDQALHTDENMGFSLALARERGWSTYAVASVMLHSHVGCAMLRGWGEACTPLTLKEGRIRKLRRDQPVEVDLAPVAAGEWLPLEERALFDADYAARPPSLRLYAWRGLTAPFARYAPPDPPAVPRLGAG